MDIIEYTQGRTVTLSAVLPGYWQGEDTPSVGGYAVLMDDGTYRYTTTRPYGLREYAYLIVADDAPDTRYRRGADATYCPGFNLWHVTASDGTVYLIDRDTRADELNATAALDTAIYLRTNGALRATYAEYVGVNPDADAWCAARGIIR